MHGPPPIRHDWIHKSEFDVPEHWLRDANRIAAHLEEADEGFACIIRGVEGFRADHGA